MSRRLKEKILELLCQQDIEKAIEAICQYPMRQVVNPLFSFFYNRDERVRWRAVIAMGVVVSRVADDEMESARVVMRRMIWNLNDESGGIGWGSPEAMGEIMARNRQLAEEYHRILISYIWEDGNFIEHEVLQRGVLWGLGRLAQVRPELVKTAASFLIPYMKSDDPNLRGLAAWVASIIPTKETKPFLDSLIHDHTMIRIFTGKDFAECSVSQLASGKCNFK